MKGIGCNIAKEAVGPIRQHKQFKTEISSLCGLISIIEARKDCMRFVCATEEQRNRLLEIETVIDKNVTVTKPYTLP